MQTGTTGSIYTSGAQATTAVSGMNLGDMRSQITTLGGLNRFGFGKSNWAHCVIYSFAVFTSGLSSEHRRGVESCDIELLEEDEVFTLLVVSLVPLRASRRTMPSSRAGPGLGAVPPTAA